MTPSLTINGIQATRDGRLVIDGAEITLEQVKAALQDTVRLNWLETAGADVDNIGSGWWRVCTRDHFIHDSTLRKTIDRSIEKG